MKAQHIKHPLLDPIEYYFCEFKSDKDIQDFEATCPWFDLSELSVQPGDTIIIKHDTSDIGGYYARLSPEYFKRVIGKQAEVYAAIYNEALSFFK